MIALVANAKSKRLAVTPMPVTIFLFMEVCSWGTQNNRLMHL